MLRTYTEEQREVFAIRPGITDPATLAYRNEEDILAAATDRERFYTEVVLPDKLRLNLDYMQRVSLGFDLALILMNLASDAAKAYATRQYFRDPLNNNFSNGRGRGATSCQDALRAKSPHARKGH